MEIYDSIDQGVADYRATPGAVLLDMRDEEDFHTDGHIPGAINMQLLTVPEDIKDYAADRDTPIFIYCYGGMRSFQAAALLEGVGYTHVASMGGFDRYHGEIEED
ncbi:MAG: rhodanese-like domain-containing protein [Clostridia bacterium]|nr:rhodanese-like domain-containing protein [Clostridia bacterium]